MAAFEKAKRVVIYLPSLLISFFFAPFILLLSSSSSYDTHLIEGKKLSKTNPM